MAGYQSHAAFLLHVLFSCFSCSSYAYQFLVGGRNGWVPNPSENYNHWAERMRFQVNDTLLFKYRQGTDSVLEVNRADYDSCNNSNPILTMNDGNSIFQFSRSGPFYFISGNTTSCNNGQKIIIVVMAVRNRPAPPSPVPSPSPASPPSGPSISPSPNAGAPSGPPGPANGPNAAGPTAQGPSGNSSATPGTPATGTPPPPSGSFAAPRGGGGSVVLVSAVSILLSVALGGAII